MCRGVSVSYTHLVNLHIQSIDHNEAIKTIKRKITDLDRMKIEMCIRDSLKRMLKAIERRQINLVITKDLSRLGRNYLQTGTLI